MNKIEAFKAEKHPLDVWPDLLRCAQEKRPAAQIDPADIERFKWYGFLHRKRDGDHYMMRVRVTGCELSAEAARELAFIAYEYGYGILDVTTRGNFQVQGLTIDRLPSARKRLQQVGLETLQTGHDNVRNIYGHPLSGLSPEELFDTRELCRRAAELVLGSKTYSDLPRKFNVALCGMREASLHFWTQDVAFLATEDEEHQVGFQVLLGGKQGQEPVLGVSLPVLVEPEQVLPVLQVLLDLFREHGDRQNRRQARFAWVIKRLGVAGVLEYLESHLPFPLRPWLREPLPPASYEDLVGWFPQKQPQRWTMGLNVPLGRLSWEQLEGLAILAKKWGDGTLRTTYDQGVLVPGIPTGFRDAAATWAAKYGLSPLGDPLSRNTIACTGKQFCNLAVSETKGAMLQLMDALRRRGVMLHGIRIHMSGCPSACGMHHTADIGLKGVRVRRLLGTREGFDVFLGGGVAGRLQPGLLYRLGVDLDQLPQLIEEVVTEYYRHHKPGQSFSAYWREKLSQQQAEKVGDHDYHLPTWLCEGCGYRYEGQDPPVFCPGCAGLRRQFARLEEETPTASTADEKSPASSAATPPAEQEPKRDAEGFLAAAPLEQVPEDTGLCITLQGREVALFRQGDQVVALDNLCPHEGGALAEGSVCQGVVTCPLHEWRFRLQDGRSVEPPGEQVARYETKIHDGQVWVRLPEAEQPPGTNSAPGTQDDRQRLGAAP